MAGESSLWLLLVSSTFRETLLLGVLHPRRSFTEDVLVWIRPHKLIPDPFRNTIFPTNYNPRFMYISHKTSAYSMLPISWHFPRSVIKLPWVRFKPLGFIAYQELTLSLRCKNSRSHVGTYGTKQEHATKMPILWPSVIHSNRHDHQLTLMIRG